MGIRVTLSSGHGSLIVPAISVAFATHAVMESDTSVPFWHKLQWPVVTGEMAAGMGPVSPEVSPPLSLVRTTREDSPCLHMSSSAMLLSSSPMFTSSGEFDSMMFSSNGPSSPISYNTSVEFCPHGPATEVPTESVPMDDDDDGASTVISYNTSVEFCVHGPATEAPTESPASPTSIFSDVGPQIPCPQEELWHDSMEMDPGQWWSCYVEEGWSECGKLLGTMEKLQFSHRSDLD